MNCKRFIIASLAVFVCLMHVWRSDMMEKMWIMHVLGFIISFIFVFVFYKGYENKGIGEGLRFGLIIGLLMNVAMLNQYPIYPISYKLALGWFVFGMIEFVVAGIVAAAIYKPKT